MKNENGLRSAHGNSVNSIFVNFDAGVVISYDEDSIRIWNPVNGMQVYQTEMNDSEDSVIPGLGSTYRMSEVTHFDS